MSNFFSQFTNVLERSFGLARVVGYTLAVVFLLLGIYFYFAKKKLDSEQEDKFRQGFTISKDELTPETKRWLNIKEMFQSKNPSDWRVAILDADSMLEDLLVRLGYEGDTFADKLKSIRKENFPWLQTAWDVHLVRNKIAHEGSNTYLNERDIQYIFRDYERIFTETGYIT
jgi:hypothetical protein